MKEYTNQFLSNMQPEVSICMSTFEHESFISEAIEGVLMQQTSFSFELIIGEDMSGDGTRKICERYAKQYPSIIRLLPSDRKYGQSGNLFRILKACTGQYIALCEGDDYWTDSFKLQKQIDFLNTHPQPVLCFHRVNNVDHENNLLHKGQPSDQVTFYKAKDLFHFTIPTMSLVFRNCLDNYPEEFFKVKGTDAFLIYMLSGFGDGADLGFIGAHYRIHRGGCYTRLTTVNKYRQSLHTRKLMKKSSFFTIEQKVEIRKEYRRRKILYLKIFVRKMQIANFIKILLADIILISIMLNIVLFIEHSTHH